MSEKRYRVKIDDDGRNTRIHVEDTQSYKQARGHTPHRSGAGVHDERPRRSRTRSDQLRNAIDSDE